MADKIQIRRGISTVWTLVNPILADGEFAYERDTKQMKIGDGVTPWNNLEYLKIEALDSKFNQDLIGVIDGVNRSFTINGTYLSNTTRVYLNGIRQRIGPDNDYIEVNNNEIRFTTAPYPDSVLLIDYS